MPTIVSSCIPFHISQFILQPVCQLSYHITATVATFMQSYSQNTFYYTILLLLVYLLLYHLTVVVYLLSYHLSASITTILPPYNQYAYYSVILYTISHSVYLLLYHLTVSMPMFLKLVRAAECTSNTLPYTMYNHL